MLNFSTFRFFKAARKMGFHGNMKRQCCESSYAVPRALGTWGTGVKS